MNCNNDIKLRYGVRCSKCGGEWFESLGAPHCHAMDREAKHADLDIGEKFPKVTPFVSHKEFRHLMGCPITDEFNGDAVDLAYSLKHYERP